MSNSTIKIPLSKNGKKYKGLYEVIVDSVDSDLAELNWTALVEDYTTYAYRMPKIDGKVKTILLHRVVLERKLDRKLKKGEFADHIDGNGLNDTRDNLRVATKAQNNRNSSKRRGTSQYKGVYWDKARNKWRASIAINGVPKFLGRFDDELEAHKAYCEAADKYFGKFANYG